jgi:hypothetical protein
MDIASLDLTVVVGLDHTTLEQWRISLPNLAMFRPALFYKPWVIFYDWRRLNGNAIVDVIEHNGLDRSPHIRLHPWPPSGIDDAQYPTQRARMLTGFVYAVREVKTAWWMKIDTDVLAVGNTKQWLETQWFRRGGGRSRRYNVMIAPSWGYTKVKGVLADRQLPHATRSANIWAETLETFGDKAFDTPRLGLSRHVVGNKITMSRTCSWVSYYRTSWTLRVAELAERLVGPCQLPIPSQDTYHWYCAERGQERYLKANQKRRQWINISKLHNLRTTANELTHGNTQQASHC